MACEQGDGAGYERRGGNEIAPAFELIPEQPDPKDWCEQSDQDRNHAKTPACRGIAA
jgi:hypothetical protein